jgi:hypothetical protein
MKIRMSPLRTDITHLTSKIKYHQFENICSAPLTLLLDKSPHNKQIIKNVSDKF